jgi:hypothetical protein
VRTPVRLVLFLGALALAAAIALSAHKPFPPDTTPDGAYLRIAKSVDDDDVAAMFPYLETDAQWASITLHDARAKACARIRASYPKDAAEPLLLAYAPLADAKGGEEVFALLAQQKGWVSELRRDLSGVAKVEVAGERASVVTARGTRYPFRRRDNGIWGLTLFSATLLAEAERASRDLTVVTAAADDYDRAK